LRIDLFLKKVCIVKSRSLAARLCDEGKVTVNGRRAKSSKDVKIDDEIKVVQSPRELTLRVIALPEGSVSKAQAHSFYRAIGQEQVARTFE
jgi:ribosomal 50S subunit-recycling heat shock protein